MSIKNLKIRLIKEEEEEVSPDAVLKLAATDDKKVDDEADGLTKILLYYPEISNVMIELMSPSFRQYVKGIYLMAPKPSTFRVILHNDQIFHLINTGKTFICKVEGKKYYLKNIGEYERAVDAISRLLLLGSPKEEVEPEAPEGGDEKSSGGEGSGGGSGKGRGRPAGSKDGDPTLKNPEGTEGSESTPDAGEADAEVNIEDDLTESRIRIVR